MWATWGGFYYVITPKEAFDVGYLGRLILYYSTQGGPFCGLLGEASIML